MHNLLKQITRIELVHFRARDSTSDLWIRNQTCLPLSQRAELHQLDFQVDIDYLQVSQLDMDAILDPTVVDPEKSLDTLPEQHKPDIDMEAVKETHGG